MPDRPAPPDPVPLPGGERERSQHAPDTRGETIGSLRRRVARDLAAAFAARRHDGTPALDARLIVAHALDLAPEAVPLHDDRPVEGQALARVLDGVARRAGGEPVARIVGHKEFHGLDFVLSADTLVPRPDTETLVDAALALVPPDESLVVVDLGTGSGAILLSVLTERRQATGIGVDIAPGAVATARANAIRLGLDRRALFVVGDWLTAIGRADVIVANPPYIEGEAIGRLDAEVSVHDPLRALDGGKDGLTAIRSIIADCGRVLGENGRLLMEIGAGQAARVAGIGEAHGMTVRFQQDLAGKDRVAILERG